MENTEKMILDKLSEIERKFIFQKTIDSKEFDEFLDIALKTPMKFRESIAHRVKYLSDSIKTIQELGII